MTNREELVTVIEGWANNWAGEIADAILAAGYRKPEPLTVIPDHDIDAERSHFCTVCGQGITWDDDIEGWTHG